MSQTGPSRMGWVSLLGLLLSAALVIYLALELDLPAVAQAVDSAQLGPLLVGTLIYCALFALRGLRWAWLLRPLVHVPTGLATRGFLIGFMANNLLPARLGDLVRAFVLARRAEVPRAASFASVLLERIFDGLVVVGILAASLSLVSVTAHLERLEQLTSLAGLMGLAFAGALSVCAGLVWAESSTLGIVQRLTRPFPTIMQERGLRLLTRVASGLHVLRSRRAAVIVLALSMLIWALEVLVYVFVAKALGLEVSVAGLALVMAVLTLGLTAPSAPGFVGVFEALVIPSLALLGVPSEEGAAFALLLHGIHYLPGTALGGLAAWSLGLRWTDLGRNAKRDESIPA